MIYYMVKRILLSIPILIGISIISFALIHLVPGDAVTTMLGAQYNEEQAEILRAKYGLDQPFYVQYGLWLSNILKGDFGHSTFTDQSVLEVIFERMPVTFELMVISLLFALFIGIPLGIWAAVKRNDLPDYLATFFGLLGISIPGFWLGTMLILFFSLTLGWFPSGDYVPFTENPWKNLHYMTLPGVSLGAAVSAVVMRMTRSAMLEVLDQEYMRTAKAKGVPERLLIFRHALKNAMIPVVTVIGIQAGYLLGGSVVIEQIFSLPGIGRLTLESIANRDYALMQGSILWIASSFVLINLIVDVFYAFLNPKIRY